MAKLNFGHVKPSFMIIGTQKGGTTSLHNYLIQHPKLIAPQKKELHFFDTRKPLNYNDYLKLFPKEYFGRSISFESTPRYLYYPDNAKKIAKFNPDIKLIISLRNPVDRSFSAWNMYKQMMNSEYLQTYFKELEISDSSEKMYSYLYENEFPSFDEWVNLELDTNFDVSTVEPSIIRRGYYKYQIEEYLKYFPKNQILILDVNSLKRKPIQVLNLISNFLEIKNFNNLKLNLSNSNERTYEDKINKKTYAKLYEHFKIKNEGLEKLVNLELDWMK